MKWGKIGEKQAKKCLLLTLVTMSVTRLSPSSSTTFTTRQSIVALIVSPVLRNDRYYTLMEQKQLEDLANNSFLCSLAEDLEMKNEKESLTTRWYFIKQRHRHSQHPVTLNWSRFLFRSVGCARR